MEVAAVPSEEHLPDTNQLQGWGSPKVGLGVLKNRKT